MHSDSGRGLPDQKKRMKKFALFAVFIFIFVIMSVARIKAQALTFDRAYQDYQFNLTAYDNAYSDYQDSVNAYKDNQTLALKETARQKTLSMLRDRDKLMAVYLTMLRTGILEQSGLSGDDKNNIFSKIDPEVTFYLNHQTQYNDGDNTDTLFSKSSQSENQYKDKTSLIVQEALYDISLGQVEGLRLEHESVYSTLKSIIDDGVAKGTLKLDPFNRWLTDIDATDQKLRQNESTSKTQIAQVYSQSYSILGGYNTAIETLTDSIIPLGQYNEFLTEVLNYIKSHE